MAALPLSSPAPVLSSTNRCLYLHITGQIEGAQIPIDHGDQGCYLRYTLVRGHDWTLLAGMEGGLTQIAQRCHDNNNTPDYIWNYPLEASFKSTNVSGWPQIVLAVYSIGSNGDCIRGYAAIHIPTQPGRHVRYGRMYVPISSSPFQRLLSWISNRPPEYFDAKFVAQGKGREVTRVQSSGIVKIVCNVVTKNMTELGYVVQGERPIAHEALSAPTPDALYTMQQSWARDQQNLLSPASMISNEELKQSNTALEIKNEVNLQSSGSPRSPVSKVMDFILRRTSRNVDGNNRLLSTTSTIASPNSELDENVTSG